METAAQSRLHDAGKRRSAGEGWKITIEAHRDDTQEQAPARSRPYAGRKELDHSILLKDMKRANFLGEIVFGREIEALGELLEIELAVAHDRLNRRARE